MSNSQSKTQETNLIYYQIKKELEEKKKDYQTVTISEYNIWQVLLAYKNIPDKFLCIKARAAVNVVF